MKIIKYTKREIKHNKVFCMIVDLMLFLTEWQRHWKDYTFKATGF